MAVKLGKLARIKLDTTDVARMTSLTVTINDGNVDATVFGDNYEKHKVTILNWGASMDGYFDLSDASQNELHSQALSGGEFTNIRFYEDATNYWKPDTATDAEAFCSVESYNWTADQSGIVSFSMSFKGSGPVTRTSD